MIDEEFHVIVMDFVGFAINESQGFVNFLNDMKQNSQVLPGNVFAITVINHIIRESEYFIGIAQTILYM